MPKKLQGNHATGLDPGLRPIYMGTTRKLESTVGSLYTFVYRSRTATDPTPIILSIRRNGSRRFKAKNGQTYMAGITLNRVSDTIKGLLIQKFANQKLITYKQLQKMKRFSPHLHYRQYNLRKVRNLHAVNSDIYVSNLQ